MAKVEVGKVALPGHQECQVWLKFGRFQFRFPVAEVHLSCNPAEDKSPIRICPELGHYRTRNQQDKAKQEVKFSDSFEIVEEKL